MSSENWGEDEEDRDKANLSLVLGIIGVVLCAPCAPFAWYFGAKTLDAIYSGSISDENITMAKIGRIMGIIGTCFLTLILLLVIPLAAIGFLAEEETMSHIGLITQSDFTLPLL